MRLIICCLSLLLTLSLTAQDVIFEFANAQTTAAGAFGSYEVDVIISTNTDFKLGSGQLYFDYNTAAFGPSAFTNGNFSVTTTGYILGQVAGFPIYSSFITADNTTGRVSFSWQQALSSFCYTENVTGTLTALMHLRFDFINGGSALSPDVCFTSMPPFDDQTFTACGPDSGPCGFSNCPANPGNQLTNDAFDCTNAALPLELLSFEAHAAGKDQALLQWTTDNEYNTSYFDIERSVDAEQWSSIGQTAAAGFTQQSSQYQYLDKSLNELPTKADNAYYRLRMVDQDGQFSYSAIENVPLAKTANISLFPNPTTNSIYLSLEEESGRGRLNLQLLNTEGKVVWTGFVQLGTKEAQLLDFGGKLSDGVYYLRSTNKGEEAINKQVVIMH